jgi:alkylation response protein AidB-like acyl-CoA dehydrogenase
MVDFFSLDATGADLVATAARITSDTAAPNAADVDARGRWPQESLGVIAQEGFLGLCLPAACGGKAQGPATYAAVVEELARGCASTAMIYVMHVSAAQAIVASSTLAGRDNLLRDIAAGKHLTTLAFSEKGSRSQFWQPQSKLTERGSGFVTSAYKSWVTSAGHADSYVASALQPAAQNPMDSTLYLLRRESPGVRVDAPFDGLGLRGNDSSPVAVENYTIGAGDLLTDQGGGATAMLQVVLPWFAVGTAAMATGICRAATDLTAQHLANVGFDSGSRLRDLPNLRARLAEMSTTTAQARALVAHTLREMAAPSEITPLYVLQARLAALEAACTVTDLGMKAGGGAAFSKHTALERLFRDARAGWVMAPTADHLKDFVGRALTGLPLF